MSQMIIDYTPIALLPSQQTGTSAPFVAPPFEMAFRRCEKLLWEGHHLQNGFQRHTWAPGHKVELGIDFFERRLSLCLTLAEVVSAKPLLEREIEGMGRCLDPRYTRCCDADCVEGWLLDGAKINVIKARILLQNLNGLMTMIKTLLEETAESACEARVLLTDESSKASSGPTNLSMDLGLPGYH
jgi:hypothetical protein